MTQLAEAPFGGRDLVVLREHCNRILTLLKHLSVDQPWPTEIASLLSKNFTILDADEQRTKIDLASSRGTLAEFGSTGGNMADARDKQALRSEIRSIAEVQACIRLICNEYDNGARVE